MSSQSRRVLTVGEFREWVKDERDDCPIRVIVYGDHGTMIGMASHTSGSQHSVGAVNVIVEKVSDDAR